MSNLFGCLLGFLFVLLILFITPILWVGKSIADIRNLGKDKEQARKAQSQSQPYASTAGQPEQGKIFSQDEGEYVDFEEVKD